MILSESVCFQTKFKNFLSRVDHHNHIGPATTDILCQFCVIEQIIIPIMLFSVRLIKMKGSLLVTKYTMKCHGGAGHPGTSYCSFLPPL